MHQLLKAILLSIFPFAELRGGIPLALFYGVNPVIAFITCTAANILIIPIIFFFLTYLHEHFMKIRLYKKTFDYFMERTRRKTHDKINKYGYLGLALFVAIPLPVTGAYTGTLAAWFFGMKKTKSFLAISLGVVTAAIIVTIVAYNGIEALSFFLK